MKLRLDQSDVTLGEMAEVEEVLGCSLAQAFDRSQARAVAALAWVTHRRDDPTFTFEQALGLKMSELEIGSPGSSGEVPGGGNGLSPPGSAASGALTPST